MPVSLRPNSAALQNPPDPRAPAAHTPEVSSGTSRHHRLSPVVYCLLVLLLPLLAVPVFLFLGRSDFFLHHGASIWVQSNDAIFNMHNRQCDVLIFGDSTAMTGIDPDLVGHATGLRTCNIAITNAVLAVTGTLTLDHFLAHNAPPRVLLVQLSPDDLQPANLAWQRTIYAEGLLELLRHGSPGEVRGVLLHHPREAVAFSGYVAGYLCYDLIRRAWSALSQQPLPEQRIVIRNGFFTPPAAARTFCTVVGTEADLRSSHPPRSFIEDLRQRYSSLGSLVLVNVAPIPACDEDLATYRAQLSGLTSNPLTSLPITLFNDNRHYTAAGSRVVSSLVAQEIKVALGQSTLPLSIEAPPIHP